MGEEAAAVERFRTTIDLFEFAVEMVRQRARRRDPQASPAALDAAVDAWLRRRPGADQGDAPGRLVPWPRPSLETLIEKRGTAIMASA